MQLMYTLMDSVQPSWGRDQGNFYRFMPVTPEFAVVEITEFLRVEKTTKFTND